VVADPLPPVVAPGDELSLAVHVVSELRHPIEDATVVARLRWTGGGDRVWRWHGRVPADRCVKVGTVRATVPDASGEMHLELLLYGPVRAANVYRTGIVTGP
jgi:hypothetical protein